MMNPFLKPFACHWTILENLRVRKAGDVRLKATRSVFIYVAPCKFEKDFHIELCVNFRRKKIS